MRESYSADFLDGYTQVIKADGASYGVDEISECCSSPKLRTSVVWFSIVAVPRYQLEPSVKL